MNPFFWPTLLLGVILFWIGWRYGLRPSRPAGRAGLWILAVVLALPGFFFSFYYTHLLGEPLWLYRFRALPGSELAAAGMGLLAGLLHRLRDVQPTMQKLTSRVGIPFLFTFLLCAPYLKPIFRPVQLPEIPNGWSEAVCRQSTPSTCGPASAASLARLAGVNVEEYTLARESFTSASGTENWYLARALRRHGLSVEFARMNPDSNDLPFPAIAGVRLTYGTGHFIPILGAQGTNYVIGDPLVGRETKSPDALREEYRFTGFCMLVK